MDELPDLQSDADVDALMARLRARVAPPVPARRAAATDAPVLAPAPEGLGDFLAMQEAFASIVVRAMELMAVTLEETALVHDGGTVARPAGRRRAPRRKGR